MSKVSLFITVRSSTKASTSNILYKLSFLLPLNTRHFNARKTTWFVFWGKHLASVVSKSSSCQTLQAKKKYLTILFSPLLLQLLRDVSSCSLLCNIRNVHKSELITQDSDFFWGSGKDVFFPLLFGQVVKIAQLLWLTRLHTFSRRGKVCPSRKAWNT